MKKRLSYFHLPLCDWSQRAEVYTLGKGIIEADYMAKTIILKVKPLCCIMFRKEIAWRRFQCHGGHDRRGNPHKKFPRDRAPEQEFNGWGSALRICRWCMSWNLVQPLCTSKVPLLAALRHPGFMLSRISFLPASYTPNDPRNNPTDCITFKRSAPSLEY